MKSSASSFGAGVAYYEAQQRKEQHLYQHPKQSSSSVTMTTRLTHHFVNLIDFMSDSNSHATDLFLRQGKHQEAMKQYQNIIETSLDTMNLWMIPSSSSSSSTQRQQTEAQIRVGQTSPPCMVTSISKDDDIMEMSYDEQAMSLLPSQNSRFIVTTGLAEPITILRAATSLTDADTTNAHLFETLRCWIMCAAVAAIHNSALILLDLHQFADAAEQISNAQSLWEDSMSSYSREECEEFILSNEECMKMMMSLHYVRSKIHIDVCFASAATASGGAGSTSPNEVEAKPSQELDEDNWPSYYQKEASSTVNQYESQQLQRREFQGWHIVQAINHLTCAYEVGQQIIARGTAGCDDEWSLSSLSSLVSPSFHQLFQSRTLSWLGFCMLMLGRRQQFDLVLDMYQSAVHCYNRIDEDDNITCKTTTPEIMNTLHCKNAPAA